MMSAVKIVKDSCVLMGHLVVCYVHSLTPLTTLTHSAALCEGVQSREARDQKIC